MHGYANHLLTVASYSTERLVKVELSAGKQISVFTQSNKLFLYYEGMYICKPYQKVHDCQIERQVLQEEVKETFLKT